MDFNTKSASSFTLKVNEPPDEPQILTLDQLYAMMNAEIQTLSEITKLPKNEVRSMLNSIKWDTDRYPATFFDEESEEDYSDDEEQDSNFRCFFQQTCSKVSTPGNKSSESAMASPQSISDAGCSGSQHDSETSHRSLPIPEALPTTPQEDDENCYKYCNKKRYSTRRDSNSEGEMSVDDNEQDEDASEDNDEQDQGSVDIDGLDDHASTDSQSSLSTSGSRGLSILSIRSSSSESSSDSSDDESSVDDLRHNGNPSFNKESSAMLVYVRQEPLNKPLQSQSQNSGSLYPEIVIVPASTICTENWSPKTPPQYQRPPPPTAPRCQRRSTTKIPYKSRYGVSPNNFGESDCDESIQENSKCKQIGWNNLRSYKQQKESKFSFKKSECEICFRPDLDPDMNYDRYGNFQPVKDHTSCKECYKDITNAILEGRVCPIHGISCPSSFCDLYLEDSVVHSILGDSPLRKKYDEVFINFFIKNTKYIAWCPNDDCDKVIFCRQFHSIRCVCGYNACFWCERERHYPIPCLLITWWERNEDEYAVQKDLMDKKILKVFRKGSKPEKEVKRCPKCGVFNENLATDHENDSTICVNCLRSFKWSRAVRVHQFASNPLSRISYSSMHHFSECYVHYKRFTMNKRLLTNLMTNQEKKGYKSEFADDVKEACFESLELLCNAMILQQFSFCHRDEFETETYVKRRNILEDSVQKLIVSFSFKPLSDEKLAASIKTINDQRKDLIKILAEDLQNRKLLICGPNLAKSFD